MELKYFYYISKTKVEMLLSQAHNRKFNFDTISPKIEYGGVGIGIDVKNKERDLIQNTLVLIEFLKKQQLLTEVRNGTILDIAQHYYRSEGAWHSGLFSFVSSLGIPVVTYVVWKPFLKSIIVLVGSPTHILGEVIVREGVFIPGSHSALDEISTFIAHYLETEEKDATARMTDLESIHGHDIETTPLGLEIEVTRPIDQVSSRYLSSIYSSEITPDAEWIEGHLNLEGYRTSVDIDGLALGNFCVKHLSRLPISQLETVFRVFRRLSISSDDRLKSMIRRLDGDARVFDYQEIYIGSPLYTALL